MLIICSKLSLISGFLVEVGSGGNPGAQKETPVWDLSLQKAEEWHYTANSSTKVNRDNQTQSECFLLLWLNLNGHSSLIIAPTPENQLLADLSLSVVWEFRSFLGLLIKNPRKREGGWGRIFSRLFFTFPNAAIKNPNVHPLHLPSPLVSLRCMDACLRLGRLPAPKADPGPTCPPENQAMAFFSYF